MTETITNLDDKLTKNFADIDARFNKVELALKDLKDFDQLSNEAQVNLLRERISHAYSYYRELGSMSQEEYRSLCDLYEIYQKCGANSYASVMMEQIHALYKEFNK